MNTFFRNIAVTTACVFGAVGLTGCATTSSSIDSSAELAQATQSKDAGVVFGKFRLVRNGQDVQLGEGVFANSATLHLNQDGDAREIVGKVGRDGQFAWVLQPGDYHITSIVFSHRGEKFSPQTNFAFTASTDHKASYVGTITLETTIDSGYLGLNGIVDRITVKDDCAADCEARLTRLGLSTDELTTSLLRWEGQVAVIN